MLDPQNTKNATSLPVFLAMFDRKGLDPFRVHNFGLFLNMSKKISYFPKKLKMLSGTPLFSWFRSIKHLRTLRKMLRNMKFGSVVHELRSESMAIKGGNTQKYEQIGP